MGETQPVRPSKSDSLDRSVRKVVDVGVDVLFLELVKLWVLALELLASSVLVSDVLKLHPNELFSLLLEVEELIGVLELAKVGLNVHEVSDVLHDLVAPLSHLLVVHELLAVAVVEKDAHFRLHLVLEVEPELLHFD